MNRFSVKINQLATQSMNYLVLGNEIFWQKIDGLYVRSDGRTTRIDMTQIDNDDDIDFYASLAYHLSQISLLAQERQQQLYAKVK
jgi:hypothetical protein